MLEALDRAGSGPESGEGTDVDSVGRATVGVVADGRHDHPEGRRLHCLRVDLAGERFEVECEDEKTRQKVLSAWRHEWEIDKEEIKAGKRSPFSSPEGIMEDMLAKLAGGEDAVECVQCPQLHEWGIFL